MVRNGRAGPGADNIASEAHGYTLGTLNEEAMKAEQVNVGDVSSDAGPEGSEVLRRARFTLKSWEGGSEPALEGPEFDGPPPYPWNAGKAEG